MSVLVGGAAGSSQRLGGGLLQGSRLMVSDVVATKITAPPSKLVGVPVPATFNDSLTEVGAASDSQQVTLAAAGAVAESGTASDSQTGSITAVGLASDALSATDSSTVTLTAIGSIAEALSASDAETGSLVTSGTVTEAVSAADSVIGGLAVAGSVAESGSAADSSIGTLAVAGALTESLSAADSATATAVLAGSVAETLAASDTSDATLGSNTFNVSVSEALSATDSSDATVVTAAALGQSWIPDWMEWRHTHRRSAASHGGSGPDQRRNKRILEAIDRALAEPDEPETVAEMPAPVVAETRPLVAQAGVKLPMPDEPTAAAPIVDAAPAPVVVRGAIRVHGLRVRAKIGHCRPTAGAGAIVRTVQTSAETGWCDAEGGALELVGAVSSTLEFGTVSPFGIQNPSEDEMSMMATLF